MSGVSLLFKPTNKPATQTRENKKQEDTTRIDISSSSIPTAITLNEIYGNSSSSGQNQHTRTLYEERFVRLYTQIESYPISESTQHSESSSLSARNAVAIASPIIRTDIPPELICPITFEVFRDPVIANDGVTYERDAVIHFRNQHNYLPCEPHVLVSEKDLLLTPNNNIKRRVQNLITRESRVENESRDTETNIKDATAPPMPDEMILEQDHTIKQQAKSDITHPPTVISNATAPPLTSEMVLQEILFIKNTLDTTNLIGRYLQVIKDFTPVNTPHKYQGTADVYYHLANVVESSVLLPNGDVLTKSDLYEKAIKGTFNNPILADACLQRAILQENTDTQMRLLFSGKFFKSTKSFNKKEVLLYTLSLNLTEEKRGRVYFELFKLHKDLNPADTIYFKTHHLKPSKCITKEDLLYKALKHSISGELLGLAYAELLNIYGYSNEEIKLRDLTITRSSLIQTMIDTLSKTHPKLLSNVLKNLGNTIGWLNVTIGGKTLSQKKCFVLALQFNFEDPDLWLSIGKMIYCKENIAGEKINREGCYVKCLTLDPKNHEAWYLLGETLGGHSQKVINGEILNDRMCYKKSLDIALSETISCANDDNCEAKCWQALGQSLLEKNEKNIIINDKSVNAQECLIKAIEKIISSNSTFAGIYKAWETLGDLIYPSGSIVINGESLTSTECYRNSLTSYKQNGPVWRKLGITLQEKEIDTDSSKHKINDEYVSVIDCFIKALTCNPLDFEAWHILRESGYPLEQGILLKERTEAQRYCLNRLIQDSEKSNAWYELGNLLLTGETETINGEAVTKKDCYIRSIENDTKNVSAWKMLGKLILKGKTETVNGECITRLDCYVKIVEINSQNSLSWSMLGEAIHKSTCIPKAVHGESVTSQTCFQKALKINPHCYESWEKLGSILGENRIIPINGEHITKQQCFIKALEINPLNISLWVGLIKTMCSMNLIEVDVNGKKITFNDIFNKLLKINPNNSRIWQGIGEVISQKNQAIDINGQSISSEYCFTMALKINPSDSLAWHKLGLHLEITGAASPKRNSQLIDRNTTCPSEISASIIINTRKVTSLDCYLRSIEIDSKNHEAWYDLGRLLHIIRSTITFNGQVLTPLDCYIKSLEITPTHDHVWHDLGVFLLGPHYKGGIVAGKFVTTETCFVTALKINPRNHLTWYQLGEYIRTSDVRKVIVNGETVDSKICSLRYQSYKKEN